MVDFPTVTVVAVTLNVVVVNCDPADPVSATKVRVDEVVSGTVKVAV